MNLLNLPNHTEKHILNLHFDNIYVLYISLYELERIKYKLEKINLNAQYFRGANGKSELASQFNDYINEHTLLKSKSYMKTAGAFGHVHSMINILADAIRKKYKKILILEPDIYFSHNFNELIVKYLNLDYKLLYLGASQNDWTKITKSENELNSSYVYNAISTCGTFAIGIDNSIFNEYMEILKKKDKPSDTCLYPIQLKYINKCLVTYPNLISCDVTKSTTVCRWRSQSELINKFRWTRIYDIDEKLTYHVNCDSIYKITIEINYADASRNCNFKISNDVGNVIPTINLPNMTLLEKKYKMLNGVKVLCEEYNIYVYSKLDKLYVYLSDIYADNIYFTEYFPDFKKNKKEIFPLFKQMITRYINSKNDQIVTYYNVMLQELEKS